MSLNPIASKASTPGRAVRFAMAGVAVVAVLLAAAMVVRAGKDPARDRVETAAGEDQRALTPPSTQRPGRPKVAEATDAERPDPPVSPATTTPTPTPTNPFAATSPAHGSASTGSAMPFGSTARPIADTPEPITRLATTPTTPQTTSTSTIPETDRPDPETPVDVTTTSVQGVVEIPTPGPPPPTEKERCLNLGGVAIGDAAIGDTASEAAWVRFRSAIPQIPASAAGMVCGTKLVAPYLDDLIIQRVQVAGKPYGILVGGTGSSHPVLWLSEVEWASYKWHSPGPTNHNFTGIPVARLTIGGYEMIRTSRGAVVLARSDSWGYTVVNGAWEVWMASGGPTGPMGLPEAKADGTIEAGAHQDFTNGRLTLPGVTLDLEAEVQPASRYVWVPLTAEQLTTPPPAPNTIQDANGVSYYVDRAGVRHWIETTSDWSCAKSDLGAAEVKTHVVGQQKLPLPGWQVARAPLGPVFTCPAKPPT